MLRNRILEPLLALLTQGISPDRIALCVAIGAAMAPTQVLLIIPFVRLGEWILRVPGRPLSVKVALDLVA